MEEVVNVSVGKVVVEEMMSLQQSCSSNYVHVQSLAVRCDVGRLYLPLSERCRRSLMASTTAENER